MSVSATRQARGLLPSRTRSRYPSNRFEPENLTRVSRLEKIKRGYKHTHKKEKNQIKSNEERILQQKNMTERKNDDNKFLAPSSLSFWAFYL